MSIYKQADGRNNLTGPAYIKGNSIVFVLFTKA